MTIDVPSEYEDVLRKAVACGQFTDEQAALRHALQLLAEEQRAGNINSTSNETPFEKATRLGLIGAASGLPDDLSSSDQYMEGFGRS